MVVLCLPRAPTAPAPAPGYPFRMVTHSPANVYLPLLAQLVALDTTSDTGQRAAAELLAGVFEAAGATVELIADRDRPGSDADANLLVTFPANIDRPEAAAAFRDPADPSRTGILLAGHLDCVPVTGQQWTSSPFRAEQREGRLYGRGTADMTSFLAVIAALGPVIAAAERAVPIYVAGTFREETTMAGARQLVEDLQVRGVRPAVCFVGEPTGMRAITAHKSVNSATVDFHGIAAHSSLPMRGLSAIRWAAEFIDWYHREIVDAFLDGPRDEGFEVPHSTGGVNMVHGGIAMNTVPERCSVTLEMRTLPSVPAEPVMERVRAKVLEVDAQMKAAAPADPAALPTGAGSAAGAVGASLTISGFFSGLAGEADGPAARAAALLGVEVAPEKVTYGTEAGFYYRAGIPTVLLGPGEIAQAHAADEFVELAQLDRLARLVETLAEAVGR